MTEKKAIRLLVADDQPVMRSSIRRLLSQSEDLLVAGEAADGGEALEKIRSGTYDLVILDISMPVKNGLEVLKEVKVENPELPILILSIHPADQYRERALELGAAAYVSKEHAGDELVDEIRRAFHHSTNDKTEPLV